MTHETKELLGNLAAIAGIAIVGIWQHFMNRHARRTQGEEFTKLQQSNAVAFAQVNAGITEVRTICVGHDGENGLRGDIRRIETEVTGLVTRERKRLEEAVLHGTPDRRRGKS